MRLYRVHPPSHEYDTPEEANRDSWHTSEVAARKEYRRWLKDLREDNFSGWVGDLALERVEIADLPRQKLALALLNQQGYVNLRVVLETAERRSP